MTKNGAPKMKGFRLIGSSEMFRPLFLIAMSLKLKNEQNNDAKWAIGLGCILLAREDSVPKHTSMIRQVEHLRIGGHIPKSARTMRQRTKSKPSFPVKLRLTLQSRSDFLSASSISPPTPATSCLTALPGRPPLRPWRRRWAAVGWRASCLSLTTRPTTCRA